MDAGNRIDERLVDEAIDAWVDWREESAAVWDAYQRWVEGPVEDAPLAFCTYRSALEREVVDGTLVKVMAWYDNEWGFAHQMIREARNIMGTSDGS
jgi:glyceraldehyde-3-phosphate dehydrogenase/erythrose-4-phosphate dehydrogenase